MSIKKTIILGIDPGLADTGYGVLSKTGSRLQFIACGSIQTSAREIFSKRLEKIYRAVEELIRKYQPDLVAVEKLYFAKNVKTALDVGQARGVALLAICRWHKPILEFTPLQVKQSVTGSGAAVKRQVGLMVKTLLGLKTVPSPDDAADALAVALTAAFTNSRLV
ncbi:MAG: crossover junction endodeoxyribonuclease RuvC [Parcubacteria group bacterium]|nr:MAG: crossover junction endodeoxyribonuclease RuvC [Parcubacteria group bacterium]